MPSTDQVVSGVTVPAAVIDQLKALIGTTDMNDQQLATVLVMTSDDGGFNLNRAAGSVWTSKAASYAQLVDVSESGSSRKLSDLHKNALSMAAQFNGAADGVILANARRSRTRAITRPSA